MIERFERLVDPLAWPDRRALGIARRVREVGGEPRTVDFIQFVREHPAGDDAR